MLGLRDSIAHWGSCETKSSVKINLCAFLIENCMWHFLFYGLLLEFIHQLIRKYVNYTAFLGNTVLFFVRTNHFCTCLLNTFQNSSGLHIIYSVVHKLLTFFILQNSFSFTHCNHYQGAASRRDSKNCKLLIFWQYRA